MCFQMNSSVLKYHTVNVCRGEGRKPNRNHHLSHFILLNIYHFTISVFGFIIGASQRLANQIIYHH